MNKAAFSNGEARWALPRIRDRDGPGGGTVRQWMKGVMVVEKWMWVIVVTAAATTAGQSFAAGTPAGTVITNRATASYTVGPSTLTANSNDALVTVAELINVAVTWQDAAPGVNVSPGQSNRVTTFRVTNTGNGNEIFDLSATGAGIAGDQFDPAVTSVYLDANANAAYDPGTDTLYSSGTSTLGPDGFVTVFLLASIPTSTITDGDIGNARLTASARTGTGAAGTVVAGGGDGGVDAVIGASTGTGSPLGVYVVSSVTLNLNKTLTVIDQFGGAQPLPGATLRFAIAATATGTGTAAGVMLSDPVPANTTYTPGTLRLNGAGLTDAAGDDAGDVGGTTAGTVTVTLGNLNSASPVQTVTFDVTIN